jgi:predicted esterase
VTPPTACAPVGLQELPTNGGRPTLLYVPTGYRPDHPIPLVVMLHGAAGDARAGIAPFLDLADEMGLLLVAPSSRRRTWDVIRGGYGPDVACIDRALELVFARYVIDPARIAAQGFSDGASYALSLGLANGDLFTHIVAFAPGFVAEGLLEGRPAIYVAHGIQDDILPVDICSRQLVPRLRRGGYQVQYHEFDGRHAVPPEIAQEASDWITGHRSNNDR